MPPRFQTTTAGARLRLVASTPSPFARPPEAILRQVAEDLVHRLGPERLEIVTTFEHRFPTALEFSATRLVCRC